MEELVAAIEASDLGDAQRAKLLEQARRLYSADGRRRHISLRGYAGSGWHRAGRWTIEIDTSNAYDGHHDLPLVRLAEDACGVASFRAEQPPGGISVAQMHSRIEFVVKRDGREVFRDDRTDLWTSIREVPFRELKLDHPALGDGDLGVSSVAFDLRKPCGADYWTIDNLSVQVAYADYEKACGGGTANDGGEYVDALNWQRKIRVYELDAELSLLTFDADNEAEHLAFFVDNLPVFQSLMEPPHLCQRRWQLYAAVSRSMVRFGEEARSISDETLRHVLWRRTYSPEAAVAIASDAKLLTTIREMRSASFLPEECCEPFYESLLQYHAEQTSGVCEHELRRIEAHARIVRRCLAPRLARLGAWCVVWDRKRRAPWAEASSSELALCVLNTAQAMVWLKERKGGVAARLPPIRTELCGYYSASVAERRVLGKCIYADDERLVIDVFKSGDTHCIPSAPIELPLGHAAEIQSELINPGRELAAELVRYLEHHDHPEQHLEEEERTEFLKAASFYARAAPDSPLQPEGDRTPIKGNEGMLAYHIVENQWYMFRSNEGSADDLRRLADLAPASSSKVGSDKLWIPQRIPTAAWLEIKAKVLEAASKVAPDSGGVVTDFFPSHRPYSTSNGKIPKDFAADGYEAAWLEANELKDVQLPVLRWLTYIDPSWRRHDCLVSITDIRGTAAEFRIYWHNGAWVYGSAKPLVVQAESRSRYRFARLPGPIKGLSLVPPETAETPLSFVVLGTPEGEDEPYVARVGAYPDFNRFSTVAAPDETKFDLLRYGRNRVSADIPNYPTTDDDPFAYKLAGLPEVADGIDEATLARLASLGVPNDDELWTLLTTKLRGKPAADAYYQARAVLALLVDQAYTNDNKRFHRISPASSVSLDGSDNITVRLLDNLGREITEKPRRFLASPADATDLAYEAEPAAAGKGYALADLGAVRMAAGADKNSFAVLFGNSVYLLVDPEDLLRTTDDSTQVPMPSALLADLPIGPASLPANPQFVQHQSGGVTFYGVRTADGQARAVVFCYARDGQLPVPVYGAVALPATEPASRISAQALTEIYLKGLPPSRWMAWLRLARETPPQQQVDILPPAPAPGPEPVPVSTAKVGETYYAADGYRIRTSDRRSIRFTDANGALRKGVFQAEDVVPPIAPNPKPAATKKTIYATERSAADGKPVAFVYSFERRESLPQSAFKRVGPALAGRKEGHRFAPIAVDSTAPVLLAALDSASFDISFKKPSEGMRDAFFYSIPPGTVSRSLNIRKKDAYEAFACLQRDERTVAIYRVKGGAGRAIVGIVRLTEAEALLAASRATGDLDASSMEVAGRAVIEVVAPPTVYLADGLVLTNDNLSARTRPDPAKLGAATSAAAPLGASAVAWQAAWAEDVFDVAPPSTVLTVIYGTLEKSSRTQLAREFFAVNKNSQLLHVRGGVEPDISVVQVPAVRSARAQELVGLSVLNAKTAFAIPGGNRIEVAPTDSLADVLNRAAAKQPKPAPPPPAVQMSRYEWIEGASGERVLWDAQSSVALLREPARGARPELVIGGGRGTRPLGTATGISLPELAQWANGKQLNTGDPRTLSIAAQLQLRLIESASLQLSADGTFLSVQFKLDATAYERVFFATPDVSPSFYHLESRAAAPPPPPPNWTDEYTAGQAVVQQMRRPEFMKTRTRLVWDDQQRLGIYYGTNRVLLSTGQSQDLGIGMPASRMESMPAVLDDPAVSLAEFSHEEKALIKRGRTRSLELVNEMAKTSVCVVRKDKFAGYDVEVIRTRDEFSYRYRPFSFANEQAEPVKLAATELEAGDRFDLLSALSATSAEQLRAALSIGFKRLITLVELSGQNLAVWNAEVPQTNAGLVSIPVDPNATEAPISFADLTRYRFLGALVVRNEKRCIERQIRIYADDAEFQLFQDGTFRHRRDGQLDLRRLWKLVKPAAPEQVVPGQDALYAALERVVGRHRTLAIVELSNGQGTLAVGGINAPAKQVQVFYRRQSPWRATGAGGEWIDLELAQVATRADDGRPAVTDASDAVLKAIVREAIAGSETPFVSSSGRRYQIAYQPNRAGVAPQDKSERLVIVNRDEARKSAAAQSCSDTVDGVSVTVDTRTRIGAIGLPTVFTLEDLTFYKPERLPDGQFAAVAPAVTALLDAIEQGFDSSPKVPKAADLQQPANGPVNPPPPLPPPPPAQPDTLPAEPYNALALSYVRGPLELPPSYRQDATVPPLNSIVVSLPIETRTLTFASFERYQSPSGRLVIARQPVGDTSITRPFGALVVVLTLPRLGARRFKLAYNLSPEVFFDPSYRQVQLKFRSNDTIAAPDYPSRILFERSNDRPLWRLTAVVVSLSPLYDRY